MAQHKNGYTRFEMKWANRCSKCNKALEKGSIGWGTKDPMTGKWLFLCDYCIGQHGALDHTATEKTPTDGSVENLEAVMGGSVSKADSMKEAIDEITGKRPPTVLEVLKAKALYREVCNG